MSYVPDVFGLNRRTVESLKAQEQQARFALAATHITLSSNVAAAAIQEASLRGQITATRQLIDINTAMLQILRQQFAQGYVARLERRGAGIAARAGRVHVTAAAEATGNATRPAQNSPADFRARSLPRSSTSPALQLPQELPVSLPSQLVAQRPDVQQARGEPPCSQRASRDRLSEPASEFEPDR